MRGFGESPIGGEVHRLLPQHLASLKLPIFVKVSLTLRLPIQWLGGALMELFKGRGSRADIDAFRDITLADLNGKDLGSFIRAALKVAISSLVGEAQQGSGFNGASTDVCRLAVTECIALSHVWTCSSGILFVDLVSAFAKVARRIAIPDLPQSEEAWRTHVHNIGFTIIEANEIIDGPLSILNWREAGASMHSLQLLRATHRVSWF